jgi:hypothetical protein
MVSSTNQTRWICLDGTAAQKKGGFLLRRVPPERKEHVVQVDHKASEDLSERAVWVEDSLGYARKHGERTLVRLLEAVKDDVEFEGTLRTVGRLSRFPKDVRRRGAAPSDDSRTETADEARKRELEEKKLRARLATWKRFMETELREIEMRKGGQLSRLLGEPLPGETPAVLHRLAEEDRQQAEDGIVALMCRGKTYYKHLDELCPEDMPARTVANRLRTTWLKQRGDVWLGQQEQGYGTGSV